MARAGEIVANIVLGGMDAVERSLRDFSDSMNEVADQANQMGDNLRNAGDGIKGFGEALMPISVGLMAMGTAGILASEEIGKGIKTFQTKLGASGDDLAKYQGVMEDVAKTGVGSFTEVADSVVVVANNMKGLSDDELSMITEEAMELAKVMGSDTAEVTKTAGLLMKNFGVEGAEAMDLIAKGYQNGMDYAGDYQDTLSEYSVYFSSMGFEAEDMFNILIEGAEKGAFNIDKVGDAVKEFGIRSKDGSDASADAFTALGMDAKALTKTFSEGGEGAKKAYADVVTALADVDDQTKRNEIGVALFGTQYEDMEADVIASTGAIVDHMQNVEGASAEVAQNNKTLASTMQGAWNEIQLAIKPVGDILKEVIVAVLPVVISMISKLSQVFTGLSPNMQKVVIAFGAFLAVLPMILIAVGGFISMIGTLVIGFGGITTGMAGVATAGTKLITGIKKIASAFRALSMLFMTNPFMLIVTGIVVVAVLIYKYWDEIVAYTKGIWSELSAWFAPYWESFKQLVSGVVDSIIAKWTEFKTGFMTILTSVGSFFSSVWEGMKSVFMTVFDFYVSYITTVFGIITSIIEGAWEVIKTIFMIALGLIVMLLAPLWNTFATGWNFIVEKATIAVNKIKQWISSMVTALMGYWNTFKTGVQAVWNFILSNVITPIVNRVKAIVTTLIAKATEVMNKVKAVFSAVWNYIYSTVVAPVIAKIKSIVNSITAFIQSVLNRVKQLWSAVFSAIKALVTASINVVKSIIQSLVARAQSTGNGVKSAFSGAFDAVRNKVSSAIDAIKSKIEGIWTKAKGVASNIKSAFSNLFSAIKVPSFSMGGWKPADLPSLPKMSVKWHANGGILDSATFIGAGEAGAEAIVPLSSQRKMKPFAMAVGRFMGDGNRGNTSNNFNISELVVREDADIHRIARELYQLQKGRGRSHGV